MTLGRRVAIGLLLTIAGSNPLDGQSPSVTPAASDSSAIDRSWSIDIAQREIVQTSFGDEASLVAVDEEGRWYLCAGAAVTADEVRINLTNVQAEVHLRADFGRLRDLLDGVVSVTDSRADDESAGVSGTRCESSIGQVPANKSPD